MYKCKNSIIITIGRTFGSGAREIGRKVAEELGIPFFDKELLEAEAKEGRICVEYLNMYDEKRPSGFLYSMALNPYAYRPNEIESLDMLARNIQTKAIKDIAGLGSCVIVGRCADQILRDEHDILSVFISASLEKRIERVSKRDRTSEKESKKIIIKADRSRRAFYNSYGEGEWGKAGNYNLCIDSGDLGIDNSAAMILQYLILKGQII